MNSLSSIIRNNINALVGRGKDISQAELARRIQVDVTYLNKVLTGAQESFPADLLPLIARELKRDIGYFTKGVDLPAAGPAATKEQADALITILQGFGFSEDRLDLVRFVLETDEKRVRVLLREIR